MNVVRNVAVLSILALAAAQPVDAQVLYGAGPQPNYDPTQPELSYLYRIDPATAEVTQIGPIGFTRVRGMDVDPLTGVMYAAAFRSTGVSGEFVLLTIDPDTGLGSEVMSWPASGGSANSRIAVRADGAIFVGWGGSGFARADPQANDLNGVSGVPSLNGETIDFGPDGRLWWIYSEGNIFWRNLATGASGPAEDVFVCCGVQIDSISFQPGTGIAFATGQFDNTWEKLYTLDPATGLLTEIGTFHPGGISVNFHIDIHALAWSENPAGPISLWSAEGNALDVVGDNHGTLQNGATFAPGQVGQAFSLDGTDDHVLVPDAPSLNVIDNKISINAWVNPASSGHGRPIAQKWAASDDGGYSLETTHSPDGPNNGLQWRVWVNGALEVLQTPPDVLQVGVWQHVAATYEGAPMNTMTIFVNGVERAQRSVTGYIDTVGDPFLIGLSSASPNHAWHGELDEIALHNRGLRGAEIMTIFQTGQAAGPAASVTTLGSSPNPSTVGEVVTLTATVHPATATGLVTFYDGTTVLGSSPLSGGQATLTTTLLPAGVRPLTAEYGGDAVLTSSVSGILYQTVSAVLQPSSTMLVSAANPSMLSQPVTLTAIVAPATATGLVTFYDGPTVLGSGMLANGQATLTTTLLPAGAHSLTALYSGDALHGPSLSAALSHDVRAAVQDSFHPPVDYGVDRPEAVAVGDFNGDGRSDLVMASRGQGVLVPFDPFYGGASVLLGNGDGSFQAAVNYATPTAAFDVAIGDFNADSQADLAVVTATSVGILLGNGNGTFQPAVSYAAGMHATRVTVADFNADGRADLAVVDAGSDSVSVLLGNGNGTFQARKGYLAGTAPTRIASADFNRDGAVDLAVGDAAAVYVLLGTGAGTFGTAIPTAMANPVSSIVAHDFNRDGYPDLVAAAANAGHVSLLVGTGTGTFSGPLTYPTGGTSSYAVIVADVFGDTFPDLVTANPQNISVLQGLPGSFLAPVHFATGNGPQALAAGDFNGDGGTDLAVANEAGAGSLSILLGTFGTTRADVNTSPSGLSFTVDGTSYTAPHTFYWFPGTAHTIATSAAQPSGTGTAWGFVDWSDGGALSHNVTAAAVPTSYTANFTTRYLLDAAVLPAGGGTIVFSPASATNYYDAGTLVQVAATANPGYSFSHWSGSIIGSASPQSVTMDLARSVVANFVPLPTTLAGSIVGKTGLNASRVWTVRLTDTGPGPALNTRITGVTFTQTFGVPCTPTVTSPAAFPLVLGDIAPGGSASGSFTVDFNRCAPTNRYTVAITFSANNGAVTGSIVRYNQFR